ncbi:hypothetical protein SESBI_19942 [Sesbania bispinosa]|nr:hypothetical protein SESBI_19942 [Sesbania bispinosa]
MSLLSDSRSSPSPPLSLPSPLNPFTDETTARGTICCRAIGTPRSTTTGNEVVSLEHRESPSMSLLIRQPLSPHQIHAAGERSKLHCLLDGRSDFGPGRSKGGGIYANGQ